MVKIRSVLLLTGYFAIFSCAQQAKEGDLIGDRQLQQNRPKDGGQGGRQGGQAGGKGGGGSGQGGRAGGEGGQGGRSRSRSPDQSKVDERQQAKQEMREFEAWIDSQDFADEMGEIQELMESLKEMDPDLDLWYSDHWEDQWDESDETRWDSEKREQGWDMDDVMAEFDEFWEDFYPEDWEDEDYERFELEIDQVLSLYELKAGKVNDQKGKNFKNDERRYQSLKDGALKSLDGRRRRIERMQEEDLDHPRHHHLRLGHVPALEHILYLAHFLLQEEAKEQENTPRPGCLLSQRSL